LYKSYLHDNFDSLIFAVKELLNEETGSEEGEISAQSGEYQIKSIVVPLGQVIQKDLSAESRSTIMEKLSSAIRKYSDFACAFPLLFN
jgi:hypothetical protein